MSTESLESLRIKIEKFRKSRSGSRSPFPADIIGDATSLLKVYKPAKLRAATKIPQSVLNKCGVAKSSLAGISDLELIRVAPILLSQSAALTIDINIEGRCSARVSGPMSVQDVGSILRTLTGDL